MHEPERSQKVLEDVLEHDDVHALKAERERSGEIESHDVPYTLVSGDTCGSFDFAQDVRSVRGQVAPEPSRASPKVQQETPSRNSRSNLGGIGWLVVPRLVGGVRQGSPSKMVIRTIAVDLRRLEPYVTGTGRTISESMTLLRAEDRLIVRSHDNRLPLSQSEEPASALAVTVEGLRGRRIAERVWQPWMLGPMGSLVTLLGVYDLIPLRLGTLKASVLRRRLSVVRRDRSVHVLTLLEGTRTRLVDEFGIAEGRVHVVSPGVDHIVRPVDDVPVESSPYALVVARCSAHKNLEVLLEAWRESGKRVGLTMVFPPQDAAGAFAERASSEGVRVLHSLSGAEIGRLTAGAACVMSPSLEEGFGLPAVEAAAAGTALFVSAIPAYREVPVDNAVLLPPLDVDAWAEAFRQVAAGRVTAARLRDNAPTWDGWRLQLGVLLDQLRTR